MNKFKNAIGIIKACGLNIKGDRKLMEEVNQVENTIIEALEKQIPKKPRKEIWVDDEKHKSNVRIATASDVLTDDNHSVITHCPNCDKWVTVQKYLSQPRFDLYCSKCGQALLWEGKNNA